MTLYNTVMIVLALFFLTLWAYGTWCDRKARVDIATTKYIVEAFGMFYATGSLSKPELTSSPYEAMTFNLREDAETVANVIGGSVGVLLG